MDNLARLGRLLFPVPLFAYPFYLFNRSPGKQGSHFDPKSDLFTESEGDLVRGGSCDRGSAVLRLSPLQR